MKTKYFIYVRKAMDDHCPGFNLPPQIVKARDGTRRSYLSTKKQNRSRSRNIQKRHLADETVRKLHSTRLAGKYLAMLQEFRGKQNLSSEKSGRIIRRFVSAHTEAKRGLARLTRLHIAGKLSDKVYRQQWEQYLKRKLQLKAIASFNEQPDSAARLGEQLN